MIAVDRRVPGLAKSIRAAALNRVASHLLLQLIDLVDLVLVQAALIDERPHQRLINGDGFVAGILELEEVQVRAHRRLPRGRRTVHAAVHLPVILSVGPRCGAQQDGRGQRE